MNPTPKFRPWPDDAVDLPTEEVIRLYESGFVGASNPPEAKIKFRQQFPMPVAEIAHSNGWAGSGAGKLVIPFVAVLEQYPQSWPGVVGQGRGDCVSWSNRNAALLTVVGDVVGGKPDEKTGKREGFPEVSAEAEAHGVLSTEAFYWFRGHGGEGWFCSEAAQIATTKAGCVLRKDYPGLADLTKYSSRTAGKWGRSRPPADVIDRLDDNLIHRAAELRSFEEIRDALFNMHGVSTCGGEGLSETRDEWGVSRRSGSWPHAMAYVGADDRPWAHQTYGGPLVLDLNSWAKWNRGPRDIYDSAQYVPAHKRDEWVAKGIVNPSTGNIMIPEGSCWVRYSEMSRRDCYAFAGTLGWERKDVPPDYRPW